MKKTTLITLIVLFVSVSSQAQEGFGTNNPDPSSVIDMTASDKGVLMPRVALTSLTDVATVPTPAHGLTVFATGGALAEGYYYWDNNNATWVRLIEANDVDLRLVGTNNHITADAGVGSNGTSSGTGDGNIAIGKDALSSVSSGRLNIAMGTFSLRNNTSGFYNIGMGQLSLNSNTSGIYNIGLGLSALRSVTIGTGNVAIGGQSLAQVDGDYNTSLGFQTGQTLGVGSHNIIIGSKIETIDSIESNTINIGNIIFGSEVTGEGQPIGANIQGNIGIGVVKPILKFEVAGKVGVHDLTGVDLVTDVIVTADATTGELKEAGPVTALVAEPWFGTDDNMGATLNTEEMYVMGDVGIGTIPSSEAVTHIAGTFAGSGDHANLLLVEDLTATSTGATGVRVRDVVASVGAPFGANGMAISNITSAAAFGATGIDVRDVTASGSFGALGMRIGNINKTAGSFGAEGLGIFGVTNSSGAGTTIGLRVNDIENTAGSSASFGVRIDKTRSAGSDYGIFMDDIGSDALGGSNTGIYIDRVRGTGANYGIRLARIGSTVAGANNSAGIRIDEVRGLGTTFGIYQSAIANDNYFAGNVGIGTTTPTEKLEVNGKIKAVDVNFSGLPTYADEAAAIIGGLTSGDMYKTVTGELRIKL